VTEAVASDFRTLVAQRIEASCEILAGRWIDQLTALVPVARGDIFPGEQPLQHAQSIIRELATYLQLPMHESIAANAVVTARATELGHLRHAQRASLHQVLREYRVLRNLIAQFIEEQTGYLDVAPKPAELIELMNRLDSVVDVLQQTTADTFVTEYTQTITEHTTRLESFNRMVTHELRQPLGTFQFAVKLLRVTETLTDPEKRERILESVERNVARMTETLSKLVELSRSAHGAESAFVQQVEMSAVTTDVIGQLREMADARGVEMRITASLPTVTIDVARLELILVNLISNAIKYSDPGKTTRVVEIASVATDRPGFCTVSIHDNGIGIAESDLKSIFARFYRGSAAERDRRTSGLGLGLAIVADCVDALKGDIHVEATLGEGTTFFLELPVAPEA
jgi:signal transduction histidine kinase